MNHLRVLSYIVKPEKEPIFCEEATIISIEDEAAGEFLSIKQDSDRNSKESGELRFDFNEWELINKAATNLIKEWSK